MVSCRRRAGDSESSGPPRIATKARTPGSEETVVTRKSVRTGRAARGLPRSLVTAIDQSKILGIRAGARSDHRFIGVWPVVVDGRVYVRSWTLKPTGWYGQFSKIRSARFRWVNGMCGSRPCESEAIESATPSNAPTRRSIRHRDRASTCVAFARFDVARARWSLSAGKSGFSLNLFS